MRFLTKYTSIGLMTCLLQACSGGSGVESDSSSSNSAPIPNIDNNSNSAPAVSITSPQAGSMAATNELAVTGTASDEDGVSAVVVNGIEASSNDQFANWTARIPLRQGFNDVVVRATDTRGNSNPRAATLRIERGYLFDNAKSVVLDARRGRAVLIEEDNASLLAVDSDTQMRNEFSGNSVGSGPAFVRPEKLFLDDRNDRALVFDSGSAAVFAVDLASGNRTVLTSNNNGAGPPLTGTSVVALHPDMLRLFALNNAQLISVDLNSGDRSSLTLSGAGIPAPRSATVDSVNNRLLVSAANNIYSVNLATGVRAPLIGSN